MNKKMKQAMNNIAKGAGSIFSMDAGQVRTYVRYRRVLNDRMSHNFNRVGDNLRYAMGKMSVEQEKEQEANARHACG